MKRLLALLLSVVTQVFSGAVTATVFAACLLFAPTAVWGQLIIGPDPLGNKSVGNTMFFSTTLGFPFFTDSGRVTVTFNGSPATITGLSSSITTGQNWLLPPVSTSPGFVTVSINSAGLIGGIYTGTVNVVTTVGTAAIQVVLVVHGTPNNVIATPNPVNFSVQAGGVISSQTVRFSSNGSPDFIAGNLVNPGITFPVGQNWVLATIADLDSFSLIVSVNALGLSPGLYTGTVFLTTGVGPVTIQVNLTVSGPTPPATPAPPSLILILTGLVAVGLYQMRRIGVRSV